MLSHGHGQLADVRAGPPAGAVVLGAALEPVEQTVGARLVTVHLPQPRALEIAGTVVDKALHVLWRIAEEQPHLVGKLPALPEAADQLGHAAPTAAAGIACLRQNALGQPVLQIAVQHGGTVEIQQRLPALEADGQQAQSLGRQQPVQPPRRPAAPPGHRRGRGADCPF